MQSMTDLVVAQKKVADSTYPLDIERWDLTSWSSSGVAFGTRNTIDGMALRRTQMRMYASERSTLLRKVGPISGGATKMHPITM